MIQEELFTLLDNMQAELNRHTRSITPSSHTANRMRYEASAKAMNMIRRGEITTETELKNEIYSNIEEKMKE